MNKPAGWLTHPDGQEQRPSVTEWLHCDVGIHSRLDVDTTGVLAFSKSEAGHRKLRTQHQEDSLNKTYLAVVSAAPSPRSGQMVDRMPNGKRAELKYTTQQINEHFAVIQITLVTEEPIKSGFNLLNGDIHSLATHASEMPLTDEHLEHFYTLNPFT